MIKTQFLTSNDISPNTHAIIYPLLRWKKFISEISYEIKIVNRNNIRNSDVIIVDSKFHKFWWGNKKLGKKAIIKDLKNLSKKCHKIVYYDSTDSSGCIQKEVIPYVDQYWKGQTLVHKNEYKKNLYKCRIFTEYFRNKYYPERNSKDEWDRLNESDIKIIKTAWNSSLTDYRFLRRGLARLASK